MVTRLRVNRGDHFGRSSGGSVIRADPLSSLFVHLALCKKKKNLNSSWNYVLKQYNNKYTTCLPENQADFL